MRQPKQKRHEREAYTLINADSKRFMPDVPSKSVDLILTDPPYNLGRYSTGNINLPWRKEINNDVADWDRVVFTPSDWTSELTRVLKPSGNIFVFTSYNMMGQWHQALDPVFDTFQFMVWHKTNSVPKIRKAGFLNSCELIICAWNKGHLWNFKSQKEMHNFLETPICMGNERLKTPKHPTQKPLRVLRPIIEIASNPGDLVLDPFMGVGSTGVAAIELERRFLGVEVERRYFDAAKDRLGKMQKPLPLRPNAIRKAQAPELAA